MEKIRILHVVPNMQSGGLETLIMNIYRNIDRDKIQFDFLVHIGFLRLSGRFVGRFWFGRCLRKSGFFPLCISEGSFPPCK